MCCFGQKILQVLVQLSHDHVCEFLTGLVEVQTTSSVYEATQLVQFLRRQAAQIQLRDISTGVKYSFCQLTSNAHTMNMWITTVLQLTLQPSSISSAGQTVMSRASMGSGASRRLMVLPVSAVSFTVMLALTEMWLKPSRDMPSRGQQMMQQRLLNLLLNATT